MNDLAFGLQVRPFAAAPLTAAYFAAESQEDARKQLQRCVERATGAGVVIAAAGMGKSLLLQLLAEQFADRFHVAHLAGAAICTRRALLQNILFELGLPYRGLHEGELRLSLIDHLQPSRQCPNGMLLLIDEAHTLPLRLLEELRLLTNLVREGSPRVRLILAGSRNLEERLANPKLDSFQQRIAVRAYLQPWTAQETAAYLRQEINRCGGDADKLFTLDTLRAIHVAAAGIPRIVNQISDHAVTLSAAAGSARIDAAAVQAAWGELQQLPLPWSEAAAVTSTIEFGSLEELASEPPGWTASPEELLEADSASQSAEPLVPSAAELFGDDFDEEVVVVDRAESIDSQSSIEMPLVEDADILPLAPSRPTLKLADVVDEPVVRAPKPARTATGPLAAHVAARSLAVAQEAAEGEKKSSLAAEDDSFDPVYPEEPAAIARTNARQSEPPHERKTVAIDSAQSTIPEPHILKTPSGGRFRNLFASLRGKKS